MEITITRYVMLGIVLIILSYQYIKLIRVLFYGKYYRSPGDPTITVEEYIIRHKTKRNFIAQFVPFYLVYKFILRTKTRIYYGVKQTKIYYSKLQ